MATSAARGEALVVRTQRQLVERPPDVDVVLQVVVPELAVLVLAAELAPLETESAGSLILCGRYRSG